MNYPTNEPSPAAKKTVGDANFHHGIRNLHTVHPSISKPNPHWDSPAFEEFDLCMEVTTYIQHWE